MKNLITGLTLIGLLVLAGIVVPVASAASPQAGQCEGYNDPANTKVDTDNDDLVLEAGLTVCIHASNSNTGSFVTDGETTLGEYIEQSGILNEGGQVPGVSNYVVYGPAPTPTPTPTATPTLPPTPTPTPTATPTLPPEPTPTPTPTLPPVGAQFSVTPDACAFEGDDTRLRFRVLAGLILLSQVDIYIDGNLIDRDDVTLVDGEAFIVVEPGLRAWTITEEGDAEAVLASGETLCPTCFAVIEPTPTPTTPPAAPTVTPTTTLPPTDMADASSGSGGTPIGQVLLLLAIGCALALTFALRWPAKR